MASCSLPSRAPEQCDARGLLIPDDIVTIKDYVKSDSVTFWSSNQFYIKATQTKNESLKDPESILKRLSAIPDHHFCHIQSLCLDFGWNDPCGFLDFGWNDPNGFLNTRHLPKRRSFERLLRNILFRGNKELVIKLPWNTTMSIPVENLSKRQLWEEYEETVSERYSALFLKFKDNFRHFGYDEDRVRFITRVDWRNALPDTIEWVYCPPNEYEENERKIFENNPISKDFVWTKLWEPARMSYGLR